MVRHYKKKSERGNYTIQTMIEAVNKVREGRSMRSVATEFGLCDRTLANYCRRLTSGNVIPQLISRVPNRVTHKKSCVVSINAATHAASSAVPATGVSSAVSGIKGVNSSDIVKVGLSSTTVSVPGPSSAPQSVPGPSSAADSFPRPSSPAPALLPEAPSVPWSQFGYARKWTVST